MSEAKAGKKIEADDVIKAYVKLRDKRAKLKQDYEEEDARLKADQEKLGTWLLEQCQRTGATQIGGQYGTAYTQIDVNASCNDWPSLWNYMKEHDRMDLVQKRVAVGAIREIFDATGEYPPGVNITQELKIVVRRK